MSLKIAITYDGHGSGLANYANFQSAVAEAVALLEGAFVAPNITIPITVDWGYIDGQPFSGLGESESFYTTFTYSTLLSTLQTLASGQSASANFKKMVTNLPAASPGVFWATVAQAQAWGLGGASVSGYCGFGATNNYTYTRQFGIAAGTYDLVGVICHELTEVMGRQGFLGQNYLELGAACQIADLLAYSSAGVSTWNSYGGYFSIDGGTTNLKNWWVNNTYDGRDWHGNDAPTNDSFNAFSSSGVLNAVSDVDYILIDCMGYPPNYAGADPLVTQGAG